MKILDEKQIQLVRNSLLRSKAYHDKVVSQHYLDDDQNAMVSDSIEVLGQISNLQPSFSGDKPLYLLSDKDKNDIEKAFQRSDEIYNNDDNFIMKASLYLALIDTIKAILHREES